MSINIIVQARMGSKRLPGKMMLDLYGEPIIFRILQRLRKCALVDRVILAIPQTNLDIILADVARRVEGIDVVVGSEENLVDRYQLASRYYESEFVIRFPGDNVFPDPNQIDNLILFHTKDNQTGFSSNLSSVFDNNMIDGVGAEIFSFDLLMKLNHTSINNLQKEHLHLNFYNYDKKVAVNSNVPVRAPTPVNALARPEYALDINTISQYGFIRDIYRNVCMGNENYSTVEIIEYLDREGFRNA